MSSAVELQAWLNGSPTGGPNGDGMYPLTYKDGLVYLVPCPLSETYSLDTMEGLLLETEEGVLLSTEGSHLVTSTVSEVIPMIENEEGAGIDTEEDAPLTVE